MTSLALKRTYTTSLTRAEHARTFGPTNIKDSHANRFRILRSAPKSLLIRRHHFNAACKASHAVSVPMSALLQLAVSIFHISPIWTIFHEYQWSSHPKSLHCDSSHHPKWLRSGLSARLGIKAFVAFRKLSFIFTAPFSFWLSVFQAIVDTTYMLCNPPNLVCHSPRD